MAPNLTHLCQQATFVVAVTAEGNVVQRQDRVRMFDKFSKNSLS